MPKYLIQGTYTAEGVKGILKEGGIGRRNAAEGFAKGLGGTLEAHYFAFGDTDVFAIVNLPDNVSAATLSLLGNAVTTGGAKITVLITA